MDRAALEFDQTLISPTKRIESKFENTRSMWYLMQDTCVSYGHFGSSF